MMLSLDDYTLKLLSLIEPEKVCFLQTKPTSQNQFMGKSFHEYHYEYRKRFQDTLLVMLGKAKTKKPRVVSFFVYHDSLFDEANLIGGLKYLPDILKDIGWIVDDNPIWFKGIYFQRPIENITGIKISIYPESDQFNTYFFKTIPKKKLKKSKLQCPQCSAYNVERIKNFSNAYECRSCEYAAVKELFNDGSKRKKVENPGKAQG